MKFYRWWVSLNEKPIGFRLEKLNILFTGLLAAVSTVLAIITLSQQTEIKGMNSLIRKQDSTIQMLAKLSEDDKDMIYQNHVMISRLDSTQRLVLEQLKATRFQTANEQKSTRPLIFLSGDFTMKRDGNDLKKYYAKIGYSNFGLRPAREVSIKLRWLINFFGDSFMEGVNFAPLITEGAMPSNQKMELTFNLSFHSEIDLKEFENGYLIAVFRYFDVLTGEYESETIIKRQSRHKDSSDDNIILSLSNPTPAESSSIKKFLKIQ